MIIFVAFVLLQNIFADDSLRRVLKSPKATLKLYGNYKSHEGLKYKGFEDRLRFRLFRKNAEFVADLNEHDNSARFGINLFSSMTNDEKKQYLGVNTTADYPEKLPNQHKVPSWHSLPSEVLWTDQGAVTPVKDQGSCGSCWTFAAVGGLETRYHQGAGVLRNFAEQEFLDCVYEDGRDGCKGGWSSRAYVYSQDNGGRLASTADYKYVGKDGPCQKNAKPDAMLALKVLDYEIAERTEDGNIEALASGSLAVAFQVTDYFRQYSSGIMKDTTCGSRVNHAVTAVGYTTKYILVKNSWGSQWGDRGFVKFARGHHNCGLFRHSVYPILSRTDVPDTVPSDPATSYQAGSDAKPDKCEDKESYCADFAGMCEFLDNSEELCPATCGNCEDVEPKPVCEDKETYCSGYAGICEFLDNYEDLCPKTCGICQDDTKPTPVCEDKETYCSDYAGICEFLDNYEDLCPKTCGICQDKQ